MVVHRGILPVAYFLFQKLVNLILLGSTGVFDGWTPVSLFLFRGWNIACFFFFFGGGGGGGL